MEYSLVRKLSLLAAGLILVTAIPAGAARRSPPSIFDSQRKGFLLGIGLGYVPVVWSHEYRRGAVKSGVNLDLLTGHGWSESNVTTVEISAAVYQKEKSPCSDLTYLQLCEGSDSFRGQMFLGGFWYHYLDRSKRPFFTLVGVGIHGSNKKHSDDYVFGFSVGCGWQFERHFHVLIRYAGNHFVNPRREPATGYLSVVFRAIAY